MDKTYRILSYTRIKPRSRPPQKKIRIFYAPRFFSGQNRKKSAQITRANTVFRLKVSKNRVLRKIFGLKREQVEAGWKSCIMRGSGISLPPRQISS